MTFAYTAYAYTFVTRQVAEEISGAATGIIDAGRDPSPAQGAHERLHWFGLIYAASLAGSPLVYA
jgi:hypothetical protein